LKWCVSLLAATVAVESPKKEAVAEVEEAPKAEESDAEEETPEVPAG
jgi:hypothetical protein